MKKLGMPLSFKKLQFSQKCKVLERAEMSPSHLGTLRVGEPVLVVSPTSQINLKTKEMLHFVYEDTNLPVVPGIPVVSEVTTPQAYQAANLLDASGEGSGIIPHSSTSTNGPSPSSISYLGSELNLGLRGRFRQVPTMPSV
ncbi:hypothetical protein C1H46_000106 [Malus baccata]|uniref:Uncharacterized protein n=1 Tax=Malus baccata TaxID=106549 RepID=A0A540NT52_MALBA|nr:hypothetical protein C1H46_000106 [Malus baccata]